MQKVLKNVVWFCLAVIPFIALYVADGGKIDIFNWGTSGLFFPFISGKNLLFRALVEIALVSWVILAINDAKYRIKKSPLIIAYALFIVILFVADMFGVDRHASMWSNFERMEGFVGHIHLFAYFVIFTSMVTAVSDWQKMFKYFIASNVLVMFYGFMQLFGSKDFFLAKIAPALSTKIGQDFPIHMSDFRLDATIGNSAYYAIYCLLFAFISAILFVNAKTKSEKWVYGIIGVLNLISLFYSGTRGTMIGFVVALLSTLGIIAWFQKGKVRQIFVATLIVVVVGVSSVFVFKDSNFVKNSKVLSYFSTISATSGTGMSRLTIWKMSYEGWKERPVLGYGQDNFSYIFPREFIPEKMWQQEPWFDRSHNVFFDWLVAGGVLGLLSYLSLFAVAMYLLWRRGGELGLKEKAIITGALVGYFIHNIFVFDNLTSYILFIALLAYIVARTSSKGVYFEHKNLGEWKEMLTPVAVVVFVGMFYYMIYLPYRTNTLVIRAMDVNRLQATSSSLAEVLEIQKDSFEKAINIGLLGKQEALEQLFQISSKMAVYQAPENMPLAEKQALVKAANELITFARNKAVEIEPGYAENVRVLDIMGMFYNTIGDGVAGERVLGKALESAPKKQLLVFDMVRSKVILGKHVEAFELARGAYELAPAYEDAGRILVLTSIYARKYDEAKALLNKNNQTIPFNGDVLNALAQNGYLNEALKMLQEYKKANPQYAKQVDDFIKQLLALPKSR